MNLRNAENYLVGLDIGTGSVGYAIVDENGELYKFKGKNTWGVRLFDGASTAATTRTHRGMRRRYNRRKQRLADLQQFLLPELEKVDPGFLARMKQSALISEDRTFNEQYVLFNSKDFTEREYYAKYPTIYHLRCDLIESKD
jgi:CRISPR-associated endonuclease Csn1